MTARRGRTETDVGEAQRDGRRTVHVNVTGRSEMRPYLELDETDVSDMRPEDVPDELVQAAMAAWRQLHTHVEFPNEWRAVIAPVLLLHEQQVRASIVNELKAHAAECTLNGLDAEAIYMAAAARYVSSDPEGGSDA